MASLAASAPVCEDAARAPAFDRPAFTATIGFAATLRRAICVKLPRIAEALEVQQDDVGAGGLRAQN